MTQARITKSSPTDSARNLVLAIKSSSRNSKEFSSLKARALNENGVGKIRNFLTIVSRITEMVQDRAMVTIND